MQQNTTSSVSSTVQHVSSLWFKDKLTNFLFLQLSTNHKKTKTNNEFRLLTVTSVNLFLALSSAWCSTVTQKLHHWNASVSHTVTLGDRKMLSFSFIPPKRLQTSSLLSCRSPLQRLWNVVVTLSLLFKCYCPILCEEKHVTQCSNVAHWRLSFTLCDTGGPHHAPDSSTLQWVEAIHCWFQSVSQLLDLLTNTKIILFIINNIVVYVNVMVTAVLLYNQQSNQTCINLTLKTVPNENTVSSCLIHVF